MSRIGWVLEYLFDLFLRHTVAATVLHVAIRVVIQIPDDGATEHDAVSFSVEL